MAAWKRICCPVDLSPESRIALEEAAELAWRLGASLTLVYVDDRPAPRAEGEALAPAAADRGTLDVERQLDGWATDARSISSGDVRLRLLAGDPADRIVRFVEAEGHDAIVMGTHSRPERERLTLGSVAAAVVRAAPCTVVVVRGRVARPADAIAAP